MDTDAARRRIQTVTDHFETLADAAAILGVDVVDLVHATGHGPMARPAATTVEAAIDALDRAVIEAEGRFPQGRTLEVGLPDGTTVIALIRGIRPLEGTAWVDLEVVGPDMFDTVVSGCYRASDLALPDLSADGSSVPTT